jgi:hypothetical protein
MGRTEEADVHRPWPTYERLGVKYQSHSRPMYCPKSGMEKTTGTKYAESSGTVSEPSIPLIVQYSLSSYWKQKSSTLESASPVAGQLHVLSSHAGLTRAARELLWLENLALPHALLQPLIRYNRGGALRMYLEVVVDEGQR